jgi:hypothetical protein
MVSYPLILANLSVRSLGPGINTLVPTQGRA